jgi:hypothetical protein
MSTHKYTNIFAPGAKQISTMLRERILATATAVIRVTPCVNNHATAKHLDDCLTDDLRRTTGGALPKATASSTNGATVAAAAAASKLWPHVLRLALLRSAGVADPDARDTDALRLVIALTEKQDARGYSHRETYHVALLAGTPATSLADAWRCANPTLRDDDDIAIHTLYAAAPQSSSSAAVHAGTPATAAPAGEAGTSAVPPIHGRSAATPSIAVLLDDDPPPDHNDYTIAPIDNLLDRDTTYVLARVHPNDPMWRITHTIALNRWEPHVCEIIAASPAHVAADAARTLWWGDRHRGGTLTTDAARKTAVISAGLRRRCPYIIALAARAEFGADHQTAVAYRFRCLGFDRRAAAIDTIINYCRANYTTDHGLWDFYSIRPSDMGESQFTDGWIRSNSVPREIIEALHLDDDDDQPPSLPPQPPAGEAGTSAVPPIHGQNEEPAEPAEEPEATPAPNPVPAPAFSPAPTPPPPPPQNRVLRRLLDVLDYFDTETKRWRVIQAEWKVRLESAKNAVESARRNAAETANGQQLLALKYHDDQPASPPAPKPPPQSSSSAGVHAGTHATAAPAAEAGTSAE